jgi:hypothetical protein
MTSGWLVKTVVAAVLLSGCFAAADEPRDAEQPEERAENSGATETNVAPAPCASDADCPDGVRCRHFSDDQTGSEGPGFCDVGEADSGCVPSETGE